MTGELFEPVGYCGNFDGKICRNKNGKNYKKKCKEYDKKTNKCYEELYLEICSPWLD